MKKTLIVLAAMLLVLGMSSVAFAAAQDVTPYIYNVAGNELVPADMNGSAAGGLNMNWTQVLNSDKGAAYRTTLVYTGYDTSTHPQGTWNSPFTSGIDGYNYNDPQDYTEENGYSPRTESGKYTVGPHGSYLTSTHKCRECHAVHRAAGKFKLTRANTRFEACDWCHGTGAGSGYNIQMDNDDGYTREYNVGHSMGFGIQNGKWKAPDDTYPAFTPPYWLGGFSCFDCHSPHANPARLLGYKDDGTLWPAPTVSIANPGHEFSGEAGDLNGDGQKDNPMFVGSPNKPTWAPGSWLLIKNPDKELNTNITPLAVQESSATPGQVYSYTVDPGEEILDLVDRAINLFSATEKYPVNKMQIDWNSPVGGNAFNIGGRGQTRVFSVSEFCTDCHDGNAGLHTIQAPMFSEDRALRSQIITSGVDGLMYISGTTRTDMRYTSISTGQPTMDPNAIGGVTNNARNPLMGETDASVSSSLTAPLDYKGQYDIAYSHDAQPRH